MEYECKCCNYITDRSDSYKKHIATAKHKKIEILTSKSGQLCLPQDNKYDCKCGKHYTTRQGLWHHAKICEYDETNNEMMNIINALDETNVNELKEKLKQTIITNNEKKPKKVTKNKVSMKDSTIANSIGNTLMNNSNNTNTINNTLNKHNISILNYVNNNYPPTKSLNKLNDGDIETILNMTPEEMGKHPFSEWIIYFYGKNLFGQFIGNFIIKAYKKENPKDQQFWSSDTQRLNFLIQRAFNSGEIAWTQDKNGNGLIKLIIDPIIDFIKTKVIEFQEICKQIMSDKKSDYDTLEKYGNYACDIKKLLVDIEHKNAHTSVLKHIAPVFQIHAI
jgi:hypothetical protein